MTLILVIGISLAVFAAMSWATRGITFINARRETEGRVGMSDQEKQILAAAQLTGWGWPSRMHRFAGGKARMKDVGVLGLALFQRLLNDKITSYPLVMLCNLATTASAVMVFVAALKFWDEKTAFLLFSLYLGCFWPHQITLTGAYHTFAQFLFLAAVFCLQNNFYSVSGFFLGLMMFTSASGRKFLPLYLGAFLWSLKAYLKPAWPDLYSVSGLAVLWGLALFLLYFAYAPLVTAMYEGRAPKFLNKLLASRDKFPLERYLKFRRGFFSSLLGLSGGLVLYAIFCLTFSGDRVFYRAHGAFFLGASLAVLLMTAPNVLANIRGYFEYWYTPKNSCHFLLYKNFFRKIGRPITDKMRGEGLRWVFLFLRRALPFHFILYLCSLALIAAGGNFWETSLVVLLSLSPIFYGELTRSPQFARPYFPALLGLLSGIGIAASQAGGGFWTAAPVIAGIGIFWNAWIFLTDILPARMSPAKLEKALQRLNVQKIYTYDTPYNDHFVNAWLQNGKKEIEVQTIRSLKEVREGFVAVPGTSSKSLSIESYDEGIRGEDFNQDPLLTELLQSKKISEAACCRFKTFGTSKVWALDSEMPSWRALILKDITDEDRWRGWAWILDASKLAEGRGDACGVC